jgi:hypothetical protein
MHNDIETIFARMPRFTADPEFKTRLKARLDEKRANLTAVRAQHRAARRPFLTYAFAAAVFCLVAVTGYGLVASRPGGSVFRPAAVSAAEIIRQYVTKFLKPDAVYHVRYRHYVDYRGQGRDKPTVYDLYEDQNSNRFRQVIDYPDGSRTEQGFDGDVRYNIDHAAREVRNEIYVYDDPAEKETQLGARTDLAAKFDRLVNEGQLTLTEGKLDTRDVWVIRDTRDTPDKFWDTLMFDRNTFQLVRTEKYRDGEMEQMVYYELEESLPRDKETLQTVFAPGAIPAGYKVLERHFNTRTGYAEPDFAETAPASPDAVPVVSVPDPEITPLLNPTPEPESD